MIIFTHTLPPECLLIQVFYRDEDEEAPIPLETEKIPAQTAEPNCVKTLQAPRPCESSVELCRFAQVWALAVSCVSALAFLSEPTTIPLSPPCVKTVTVCVLARDSGHIYACWGNSSSTELPPAGVDET